MADRRMFTKKVTDDDNFVTLSSSAQALYLHLMMSADDDGFCNQVNTSMFKAHASIQDLEALLSRRYLYQFENGVIVIKHWRMANALRKDRYTPTAFKEELAMLSVKNNGAYTLGNQTATKRQPNGNQTATQASIGKNSIEENNSKQYIPTLEEVNQYLLELGNITIRGEDFIEKYDACGWTLHGEPIKNWKNVLRGWIRQESKRDLSESEDELPF